MLCLSSAVSLYLSLVSLAPCLAFSLSLYHVFFVLLSLSLSLFFVSVCFSLSFSFFASPSTIPEYVARRCRSLTRHSKDNDDHPPPIESRPPSKLSGPETALHTCNIGSQGLGCSGFRVAWERLLCSLFSAFAPCNGMLTHRNFCVTYHACAELHCRDLFEGNSSNKLYFLVLLRPQPLSDLGFRIRVFR